MSVFTRGLSLGAPKLVHQTMVNRCNFGRGQASVGLRHICRSERGQVTMVALHILTMALAAWRYNMCCNGDRSARSDLRRAQTSIRKE